MGLRTFDGKGVKSLSRSLSLPTYFNDNNDNNNGNRKYGTHARVFAQTLACTKEQQE